MAAFPGDKKCFAVAFAALLALHLTVVLTSRLLPFTDLPDHLAAATVARHTGEPGNEFARHYRVDAALRPNTAHLLFCSLRLFPSVEAANRALFALYVVLLPLSVLLILRKLDGNPWYALLSFLFLYNYSASWGFVGFALAVPLVLIFCLLFVIDARGVGGAGRAAGASAFLLALYFVHVLAALFALLVLLVSLAFQGRRSPGNLARGLLAAVPFLAVTAAWWRAESRGYAGPGLAEHLSVYYGSAYLPTLLARRSVLVFDNYHLFDGWAGYAAAALFSAAVIAVAAAALVTRRGAAGPAPALSRPAAGGGTMPAPSADRPAAAALPIAALLCCLFLPNEIPQQSVLYERFSVFLFLGLAIAGGARAARGIPRALAAGLLALAVLHGALWAQYFAAFNRENEGFDAAFLRASGGGKLAGLVYDYRFRGRPLYIHFPSYHIVWERGIATASFADFRFGAVRRRSSGVELPRYLEWLGKTGSYDGRYAGMDLILARGAVPGSEALAPFEKLRERGKWSLYVRRPAHPAPALPPARETPSPGPAPPAGAQ